MPPYIIITYINLQLKCYFYSKSRSLAQLLQEINNWKILFYCLFSFHVLFIKSPNEIFVEFIVIYCEGEKEFFHS